MLIVFRQLKEVILIWSMTRGFKDRVEEKKKKNGEMSLKFLNQKNDEKNILLCFFLSLELLFYFWQVAFWPEFCEERKNRNN
jgi:hypothetical protein